MRNEKLEMSNYDYPIRQTLPSTYGGAVRAEIFLKSIKIFSEI